MEEERTELGLIFFCIKEKLYPTIPALRDGVRGAKIPPSDLCPCCKEKLLLLFPFNRNGIKPA